MTKLKNPVVVPVFLVSLVSLSPQSVKPAQACAAADRLRRFPLGSVGSEIVLAELEEHRSHLRTPMSRPNLCWKGRIWLRRANAKGRLKKRGKSIGTYRAMVSTYYRDVRRPLKLALKQAKKIRGFRAFAKPKLYGCFNKTQCGPFRLKVIKKRLYLSTNRGKRQLNVRWMQNKLKGSFHHPGLTPTKTMKNSVFAYLLQYKWGHRAVLAANVSPVLDKKYFGSVGFTPSSCRSLVSCAAPAGVSDHMVGMDVVAVMPWGWIKTTGRSPKNKPQKR